MTTILPSWSSAGRRMLAATGVAMLAEVALMALLAMLGQASLVVQALFPFCWLGTLWAGSALALLRS